VAVGCCAWAVPGLAEAAVLTALPLWAGRGGRAGLAALEAQFQPPDASGWQANCSAAKTKGTATGCNASRPPVTNRGNFLRNAGYLTAILFFGPCLRRAIGRLGRTPLDGLRKMQDNKA